jgi:hypothetical protein
MSEIGVEPAVVENALGVEALLQIAVQRQQCGSEWCEDAVGRRNATGQGGVPARDFCSLT